MVTQNSFPQSGDKGFAEDFAAHVGHSNLSDYVETGLEFQNVDYSNLTADVTTGKAFVLKDESSKGNGESVLHALYALHVPSETIPLSSSTVNYVYLDGNVGSNDSPLINVYTNDANASSDELLLGEIDTSSNSQSLKNRNPDIEVGRFRSFLDLGIPIYGEVRKAESGEGNIIYITGDSSDTQGLWYYTKSGWKYSGIQSLRDDDVDGVTGLIEDSSSNRPTASKEGRIFFETDTQSVYYDDGNSWIRLSLDASKISPSDLGFDPATQTELNQHEGTADAHHSKTVSLDELDDSDASDIIIDNESNRPSAGSSGTVFISSNTGIIQYDSGSSWKNIGVTSHSQLSGVNTDDHHTKTTSLEEIADSDASEIIANTESNLPSQGTKNRVFIASDTGRVKYDNGSEWIGLNADLFEGLEVTQFLRADKADTWKANNFTFEGPDDGSGTVKISPGSDTADTGTPSMNLDLEDALLKLGEGSYFGMRYHGDTDSMVWSDESNGEDRMSLDRTNGNLSIEGEYVEGSAL